MALVIVRRVLYVTSGIVQHEGTLPICSRKVPRKKFMGRDLMKLILSLR